jgi:2-haloacid dehalogenase
MRSQGPVVTFDLFSALIDSRSGGSAALARLGEVHGWQVEGSQVYDRWDVVNKAAQKDVTTWMPYADLAERSLAAVYEALDLAGDPHAGAATLLGSMAHWPLWPDVADTLPCLATKYPIGILSNVDDDLFARTRVAVAALVDPALVMTSQRLQAYKPHAAIYQRARQLLGPMIHVATSARDVRGALEADLPVVRLQRPGHGLDPDSPQPENVAQSLSGLEPLLELMAAGETAGIVGHQPDQELQDQD